MKPLILLASMLLSSPPAPEPVTADAICVDGKLVAIEIQAPSAGTIKIQLPPDVCAATEKPAPRVPAPRSA